MSDTSKISARSGDNDDDFKSLFDTFYDATGSPSPEQEPAITRLKTLQADFESISTDIQSLENDIKGPTIDAKARAMSTEASPADTSNNPIRGTGNDTNTSSVGQAGPAADYRHSSFSVDDVKYIDLSVQIHDALPDEKQTGKVLLAAKGRVEAVWHIWEAKMQRDEIAELDKKYDDLRAEYAKLEDEAAMVAVRLAAKRCDAREWKVMAGQEDWQSILDEDLDKK
ncbi:hypothetical protein FANTH_14853 [Fusarium anthophilum]|uniref:Uncharacterized protein n=1 Tax=Fusarium anthophilum TaxID=48485 RepID=A0A8H4YFH7_9HYPO|nr:hypothetical protein FANTH_14853 [Fusarium anthophilum]